MNFSRKFQNLPNLCFRLFTQFAIATFPGRIRPERAFQSRCYYKIVNLLTYELTKDIFNYAELIVHKSI